MILNKNNNDLLSAVFAQNNDSLFRKGEAIIFLLTILTF